MNLYIHKGNSTLCVNELLIKDNYATLKTTNDLTLRQQRILFDSNAAKGSPLAKTSVVKSSNIDGATEMSLSFAGVEEQSTSRSVNSELTRKNIIPSHTSYNEHKKYDFTPSRTSSNGEQIRNTRYTPDTTRFNEDINILPNTMEVIENYKRQVNIDNEKEEQQRRIQQHANSEVDAFLAILGDTGRGGINSTTGSLREKGSGTSDLSDMETTPAPKMVSFKSRQSSFNPTKLVTDALGKEYCDDVKRSVGIACEEESSAPETVERLHFSPDGYNSREFETPKSSKKFDFIDPGHGARSQRRSNLEEASLFMQGLFLDPTSSLDKSGHKNTKTGDNEVLVYGKLKRKPFSKLDLDLPFPLQTSLSNLKFKTATPFQSHVWPAVAAFRHVVGIPEASTNCISKVIAYFLPILQNLISKKTYQDISKGNGVSYYYFH